MPLGLIGRAGRAMAGYGARNAAAGGYMTRGIGAVGRFVGRNPQATMYGGMMGIGAGIGAFSDSDSVVGNSLQWGAMGAGLRYGGAGVRGWRNAMLDRGSRWGQAMNAVGYAGRADFNRLMAMGRRSSFQIGNTAQRTANRVRSSMKKPIYGPRGPGQFTMR